MYFKSLFKFECQPVALANALVWSGKELNYSRDRRKLWDLCGYSEEDSGCSYWGFSSILFREGKGLFSVTTVENPFLHEVEEHIGSGPDKAAIISYRFEHPDLGRARHVVMIPGKTIDGKYYVLNKCSGDGDVATLLTSEGLNKLLATQIPNDPTTAYLLTKNASYPRSLLSRLRRFGRRPYNVSI